MSVSVTFFAFMRIDAVSFAATATGHRGAWGGYVVLSDGQDTAGDDLQKFSVLGDRCEHPHAVGTIDSETLCFRESVELGMKCVFGNFSK